MKTEARFTPGPWKAVNVNDLCSPEIVGNGRNVAMVRQPFASDGEIAANGRLIAQAPEMYRVLQSLKNEVSGALLGIAKDEIRAAIGNTNLRCIENRLAEAEKVLKQAGESL